MPVLLARGLQCGIVAATAVPPDTPALRDEEDE
jgi:hypothetical protein